MKRMLSFFLMVTMLMSVCIITGTTAFAIESASDTPTDFDVLSDELQTLENEANKKYNKLLEVWAYDPQFIDDVDANFPAFYGGAYINEEKELVIQVTSLDENITKYFENIIDLTNVVFEEVKYSYEELKQVYTEIAKKMDARSTDSLVSKITGVGISFPDNAVNLYLAATESAAKSMSTIREIQNKISTFEHIKIVATSGKDIPVDAVEPGTEIYNTTVSRSVGFWAVDQDGNLGIVTAPHNNLFKGDNVSVGTDNISVGTPIFGIASTPYYSGNVDAVFVKRTNTYFSPSNFVSGWNFNLTANGYTILAVGSTIYSKGFVSGCQTGKVTDTNYSTSYGLSDCVLTTGIGAHGDSGGIVAGGGTTSVRYVAGMITGMQNTTNHTVYVKTKNILSTLGVSIYAGTKGYDLMQPQDASWSAKNNNVDGEGNDDHIAIQLVDDTLTARGAQLALYNGSTNTISFGSDYFIQCYENNAWRDIKVGQVDWTAELIRVNANCGYQVNLDWYSIYGELPSGRYRICKEYEQENQPNLTFYEFEIQ